MKIAVWINEHDEIVSPFETSSISVFEHNSSAWEKKKEVELKLGSGLSLSDTRKLVKTACQALDDCEVFLLSEVKGLIPVLLQEQGIRTWKSQGPLVTQLEFVARKDTEDRKARELVQTRIKEYQSSSCGGGCHGRKSSAALADSRKKIPEPQIVGEIKNKYYRIDLAQVMQDDPTLNSQQVLIPFLEKREFNQLEILAEHQPRWLVRKLDQLALKIKTEAATQQGVKLIIAPLEEQK